LGALHFQQTLGVTAVFRALCHRIYPSKIVLHFVLWCLTACFAAASTAAPLATIATATQGNIEKTKAAADNFRGNGWWWGGPSLSGTGFFVEAQGDLAFVTFFMYDIGGRATWYAASGTFRELGNGSYAFTGDLLGFRDGQPASSNTPATPSNQFVGPLSITFSSATSATVQLPSRTFAAQRFDFGGLNSARTGNQPETGWYWNASQSGRGYAIEVQGGTVFFAMFHYNTDGSPTWNLFTGPVGANGALSGDFLAYTGGQSLDGAYRSPNAPTGTPGFAASFSSPCEGALTFPGNPVQTFITRFAFGVSENAACKSSAGGGGGTATAFDYKTTPTSTGASATIAALNQQGAIGFAFVSSFVHTTNFGSGQPPNYQFYDLFAKGPANATYQYKAIVPGSTAQAWASQLNAEGAAGYLFKAPTFLTPTPSPSDTYYNLLVKSSARNTTYSYRVIEIASPSELSLANLNAEGNTGYAFRGNFGIGATYYRLHVKDNGSNATYSYAVTPAIDTVDGLLSEMNAQGAQFYMYKSAYFTGSTTISLYEKASTTTAPIEFLRAASGPTISETDLLARVSPIGDQGFLYWGDLALMGATQYASFFYKGPPATHPLYGPVFP
jgi:hypothetical protein